MDNKFRLYNVHTVPLKTDSILPFVFSSLLLVFWSVHSFSFPLELSLFPISFFQWHLFLTIKKIHSNVTQLKTSVIVITKWCMSPTVRHIIRNIAVVPPICIHQQLFHYALHCTSLQFFLFMILKENSSQLSNCYNSIHCNF